MVSIEKLKDLDYFNFDSVEECKKHNVSMQGWKHSTICHEKANKFHEKLSEKILRELHEESSELTILVSFGFTMLFLAFGCLLLFLDCCNNMPLFIFFKRFLPTHFSFSSHLLLLYSLSTFLVLLFVVCIMLAYKRVGMRTNRIPLHILLLTFFIPFAVFLVTYYTDKENLFLHILFSMHVIISLAFFAALITDLLSGLQGSFTFFWGDFFIYFGIEMSVLVVCCISAVFMKDIAIIVRFWVLAPIILLLFLNVFWSVLFFSPFAAHCYKAARALIATLNRYVNDDRRKVERRRDFVQFNTWLVVRRFACSLVCLASSILVIAVLLVQLSAARARDSAGGLPKGVEAWARGWRGTFLWAVGLMVAQWGVLYRLVLADVRARRKVAWVGGSLKTIGKARERERKMLNELLFG